MNKIFLIIQREYLTRVRKRSFLIMTILGPVLMAATIIIPVYLATQSNEMKTVDVLDETGLFREKFKNSDDLTFRYLESNLQDAKETFTKSGDHALLYIPMTSGALPVNAIIYSQKSVNINVLTNIRNVMNRELEQLKLQARLEEMNADQQETINVKELLQSIKTSVDVSTIKIEDDGSESKSYTEMNMILGFVAGLLIYFFIFMFGSQVMRGVIEEKTNRIVEVIVSSVRPFQLMMGKIVGVGLVGLTQFLLWVILTFAIVTVFTSGIISDTGKIPPTAQLVQPNTLPSAGQPSVAAEKQEDSTREVLDAISTIQFPALIGSFLFYFIFGYLMYAALLAAIGGAVDNEADTQQFMLPVTMPLILAIVLAQFFIQEPNGALAFWLSIIPLTSPVVMMIRIPFGVPVWEVWLSMALLILGILGAIWMAGKIYRTGILMYGKKVNYKELWKWLRYRN